MAMSLRTFTAMVYSSMPPPRAGVTSDYPDPTSFIVDSADAVFADFTAPVCSSTPPARVGTQLIALDPTSFHSRVRAVRSSRTSTAMVCSSTLPEPGGIG